MRQHNVTPTCDIKSYWDEDEQPKVTNYYVYGLGLLYEITETVTGTNLLFYHYDLRGSTVALTDASGNVTDRIEYSAYGLITYRAGTNDTPFLFNGRYGVQTDPNGLLYMRARYYNPYICRFLNPDPLGFAGGLNFYVYADGNPVSLIDPIGFQGTFGSESHFLTGYPDGFGTGLIGSAGVFEQAGVVRDNYNALVRQLQTTGTYSAERDAIRAFFNEPGNSTALSRAFADMYRWEQSLSGTPRSMANPTVTATAVNNAAAVAKWGGRGIMVIGAGLSVYNVTVAEDPYRAMVSEGSAIVLGYGGAELGAWGGAALGTLVFPGPGTAVGAVIGAIGGGIGGGLTGYWLGEQAYSSIYGTPNGLK